MYRTVHHFNFAQSLITTWWSNQLASWGSQQRSLICGNEIVCDVGVPKGNPIRYFTVNLLRTVNLGRADGCTCIYYWVTGVYCGSDGVGSVKFVIWTENKRRNIREIFIVNKIHFWPRCENLLIFPENLTQAKLLSFTEQ